MPEVRDFSEVLEFVGPFVYFERETYPVGATIGENEVSEFCSVQIAGTRTHTIRVKPRDETLLALRGRLVTPDDRLSWKVIGHKDTDHALIILYHGYTLGSHWLAYVETST